MKFTNYLSDIDGVSIYPLISLIIFMSVFLLSVVYVYTMDKKTLDDDANIPFD